MSHVSGSSSSSAVQAETTPLVELVYDPNPFLEMIQDCKYVERTVRIDPHIYAQMQRRNDDFCFEFIATQEHDGWGTLVAQYPEIPPCPDCWQRVDLLYRRIGDGKFPPVQHLVQDRSGIIRAECRLLLTSGFYGQDNVDDAVLKFYRECRTLWPFVDRMLNGVDLELVMNEAVSAMEAMRNC
jgi:hypothetical protein